MQNYLELIFSTFEVIILILWIFPYIFFPWYSRFMWDKIDPIDFAVLQLALLRSFPYIFFPFGTTHHQLLCTYLFDADLSNKDKVILINLSANIILLVLIYITRTVRPLLVEPIYSVLMYHKLPYLGYCPIWIHYRNAHCPSVLDIFQASDSGLCSSVSIGRVWPSFHSFDWFSFQ